jgi:hypothetical protein
VNSGRGSTHLGFERPSERGTYNPPLGDDCRDQGRWGDIKCRCIYLHAFGSYTRAAEGCDFEAISFFYGDVFSVRSPGIDRGGGGSYVEWDVMT